MYITIVTKKFNSSNLSKSCSNSFPKFWSRSGINPEECSNMFNARSRAFSISRTYFEHWYNFKMYSTSRTPYKNYKDSTQKTRKQILNV